MKLCEKDMPAAYHYFHSPLIPETASELPLVQPPAQLKPTAAQKKGAWLVKNNPAASKKKGVTKVEK